MYSIFSTKANKRTYLEEGEPPPKKTITEKDILVKRLAENQLKTKITLTEQLHTKKEFTPSESITNITSYVSGKTALKDFQAKVSNIDEINGLKSKGLSDKDIEIYQNYKTLGPEFWLKYKGINEEVLRQQINEIDTTVNSCDEYSRRESNFSTLYSKTEPIKCISNNEPNEDHFTSPMDELVSLEKQFTNDINEYSKVDIKKIRKKARSIGNKIKNLDIATKLVDTEECGTSIVKNKNSHRPTLWDVKEKPAYLEKKVEIIDKDKIYSCKPQNWYTIKDKKIIKLDEDKRIPKTCTNVQNQFEKSKLTVEEIRKISKFSNYNPGIPSKVLYVKNLGKTTTESDLKRYLKEFQEESCSVKIMNGKMRGQAFIEFQDKGLASQALESLNGVLHNGKPIIVQFGKNKDP